MSEPVLALAASPREWARRLHRHVTDHGGAVVRCTVLDAHGCLAEPYDVLVVDDTTSFLSHNLVTQLRAQGRRVLGVYDPDDPRGKQDLLDLGVDDVAERGAEADELVRAVAGLMGGAAGVDAAVDGGDGPHASVVAAAGARHANDPEAVHRPAADGRAGALLAVAGAAGGVGASEVALALACVAGARGRRVVLVDADDAGPSLAQRLGAAPYPNLRSAVDAVEHRAGDLTRSLRPVQPGMALLPGLASPQDWAHLRPVEVLAVITRLRAMADVVVVDIGDGVEDLTAWGGPPRHGLARALLGAAERALVVAAATPVGIARLLAWCAEARGVVGEVDTGELVVGLNRVPRAAFARRQLLEEVHAGLGAATCVLLPADPRVDEAAWAGEALLRGPFLQAAGQLAETLLELPAPRARRWRRSLRAAW